MLSQSLCGMVEIYLATFLRPTLFPLHHLPVHFLEFTNFKTTRSRSSFTTASSKHDTKVAEPVERLIQTRRRNPLLFIVF
jgi:hypothetical protein